MYSSEHRKLSKLSIILIVFLFITIVVASFFSVKKFFFDNEKKDPNVSDFSAIFLSNSQVYFGIISEKDGDDDFLVLKNIFYLQAVQSLQGVEKQDQPFSLVKLGKELHGPADIMYINRAHILFYENLRKDGGVVKSIENYKPE